jgi:hypothetical protein
MGNSGVAVANFYKDGHIGSAEAVRTADGPLQEKWKYILFQKRTWT